MALSNGAVNADALSKSSLCGLIVRVSTNTFAVGVIVAFGIILIKLR